MALLQMFQGLKQLTSTANMQPTTLTQGQSYMGGTVQYDTATGKPLAKGATTMSSVVGTPDKPIATNQYSEAIGPKPVPFLSSESGGNAIQKDLTKLDAITAPKPASTVVKTQQQLDAESGKHNPYGYDATGKALANPNAGDNSFTPDQLTEAGITDPIAEGLSYNASTGTYYVANNAPSNAQSFLEFTRGNQQANTSLQNDSDWALNEMKKGISGVDAVLADTLANISADYQNRKAQLEQANNANLSQIQTQGYRYGTARYSSSLNTQLISTEERAGMQKLSELAVQTQSLIASAKQAAASQKFDMLSKYMDEIDKKRQEQAKAAEKLAADKAAQDKIIADRLRQSTIDTNVSSLLAKGVTDPKDILGALNYDSKGNLVGDVSSKDIADAIKNLTQDDPQAKNVFDIQKEAAKNGAPKEVLAAIAKSPNGTAAISAAGEYLMEGSGVIGEYLFYKRDALARGIVPVDPDTYMTMDANRKAKVAAAANANGLSNQTLTRVLSIAGQFDAEPIVKEYNVVKEAKQFVDSLSNTTTNPSDDQGLVYAFAKVMDPNSVVREGEYRTVQNYAQSWIKAFGSGMEQAINGTGFLSDEARKNIKKTIASKAAASERTYKSTYNEYTRRINKVSGGKDGADYITDYSKGYDQQGGTGSDLIQSGIQAKAKVDAYIKDHPTEGDKIAKLYETPSPAFGGHVPTDEQIAEYLNLP